MSIAASRLKLTKTGSDNATEREHEVLEKLIEPLPFKSEHIIAIDLDDVLCQTNEILCQWHNKHYGTNMNLANFYYYYYWKNPFWGTPKETFEKVKQFYSTDLVFRAKPIPGAQEGLEALRGMGYRLIIVTARYEDHSDESWQWVNKHFPGIFDSIICTGQFQNAHKAGHEVVTKLTKAQVCEDLKAKLLIDDSAENAIQCATAAKPTPVLLFGDYQWNQRLSGPGDARDEMSFEIRLKAAGGHEFWKDEGVPVPPHAPLWRVANWEQVVQWVRTARAENRI